MNLHLILLLGYSILLILIGLWMSRRVRGSGDFFVAGRALGPGLVFSTIVAANIGAGSTVGAAGLGYRDGLSGWWWVGSVGLGTLVLAFWVGPKVRRLASERGFYTVGDLLEYRYGAAVRGTIAALLWVGTLAILAGQLIALSRVLEVVAGIPKAAGCLIGGVVMTTYFTAGGLVGAAWINLIQLIVLVGGFAVALPVALHSAGGWSVLMPAAQRVGPEYLNFWSGGGSGWALFPLLAPAFIVSPGLLQKVYGARDARAVRLGVGLSGVALLLFAFAPTLLGMTARVLHPELSHQELALPQLLMDDVPLLVGAIGLGALFVADVSSADAILFMLATSLSQDLYRRFVRPDADDARILAVARWAALWGGAAGVALAVVSPSVVDALSIFYSLVGICLFVPVIVGLYTGRAGAPEALASVAAGIVVTVWVALVTDGAGFGPLTPNLLGLTAAAGGFGAIVVARVASGRLHLRDADAR